MNVFFNSCSIRVLDSSLVRVEIGNDGDYGLVRFHQRLFVSSKISPSLKLIHTPSTHVRDCGKQVYLGFKRLVDKERAFGQIELKKARASVQRVEEALQSFS
ncbi:hypothetical protein L6452_02928 [Arctium lappa]|uniref:Uncharacterized protein n=1 Tax=Arctium lappa TaxID=4217 RepID=A0ACB9FM24_ARCLA|nr:hypothetical protein L6452_02928 [Arctium lappa]